MAVLGHVSGAQIDRRARGGTEAADRFTLRREQQPVVAADRNDVSRVGDLAAGDPHDPVFGSELADGEAHPLDGVVEGVNVVVGGGRDGHRAAVEGVSNPVPGDDVEMVEERASDDPAMGRISVERSRAPGSQL